MSQVPELTTAETLVLDLVIARCRLGVMRPVFESRLWIKPQLDSLAHRGLVTWHFDDNADFQVTPTQELLEVIGARPPVLSDARQRGVRVIGG